jgi:tape measure domain-containing protein
MSTIEERIVSMKFNNSQFASGIKSTLDSLDSLKKGLNLDSAAKSLETLGTVGKNFSLSSIASGVDAISSKFSALSIAGITALTNIANKAVNVGLTVAKSLTIDPVMQGFQEYEAGLKAFQTILANTKSSGTSIDQVNKAMEQLNVYANQTIYSFGDMTSAIGLFTAQGVNLGDSLTGIKGIYNIVSLTGGDANKAQGAIYQLSQAIAGGTVRAQDWISVVNAGIGGTDFQNQLKQTARVHGVNVDGMIKKNGSFKDSLQEGWLSSGILLETLSQYTGDLSNEQLASIGYTAEQIAQIQELGKTANNSATQLKSFTQLMDTLKSNVVTGWSTSWKTVIGTLDEAIPLWTGAGTAIGSMMQASSDARNKMLTDWAVLGGRTALIDSIKNAFTALMTIVNAIKGAFQDVFPPTTGKQLYDLTVSIDNFTKKLIMGESAASNLKKTFEGVFAIFSIIKQVIQAVGGVIAGVLSPLFSNLNLASGGLLAVTASASTWIIALDEMMKKTGYFSDTFAKVSAAVKPVSDFIAAAAAKISSLITVISSAGFGPTMDKITTGTNNLRVGLDALVSGPIQSMQSKLSGPIAALKAFEIAIIDAFHAFISGDAGSATDRLQNAGTAIADAWDKINPIFEHIKGNLITFGSTVASVFSFAKTEIQRFLTGIDPNVAMGTLNLGIFAAVIVLAKKFIASLTSGATFGIKDTLQQLTSTLKSMQTELKAKALLEIAAAVLVLAGAVFAMSMIDPARLLPAVAAMTIMLAEMLGAMKIMTMITESKGFLKIPILSLSLLLLGGALLLFATAALKFATVSWEDLGKGLLGVAVVLAASGLAKGGAVDAIALFALAGAINVLAGAFMILSKLSWEELGKGAATMAVMLGLIAAFGAIPFDATKVLISAAAMVVLAGALTALTGVVFLLNSVPWPVFLDGMGKVAIALVAIALAMQLMPVTAILSAAAIGITALSLGLLAGAILLFNGMDWGTFAKGLGMIGLTLLVLAVGLTAMVAALPGALALGVAAVGLGLLFPVLLALSAINMGAFAISLGILAAAFLVIGVGSLLLVPAAVVLMAFALAIGLMSVASMAAGVGLSLMGVGLTAIAVSGAVAIPLLMALMLAVVNLIPVLLQKIGEGIVGFALIITAGAPVIVGAFTAIMLALIDSLNAIIQPLVDLIGVLLLAMVAKIVELTPTLVAAGWTILLAFLTGIENHIGDVVTVVGRIITSFLNAMTVQVPAIVRSATALILAFLTELGNSGEAIRNKATDLIITFIAGIGDSSLKIANAAADMIIKFVNGLGDSIRTHSAEMNTAGGNLASAIIDGMTSGIRNGVGNVVAAAKKMASDALSAAKNFLGIKSPSKKFAEVGEYSAEGVALGFNNRRDLVTQSAIGLGESALAAMKTVIARIGDAVSSNVDMTPTISPVLDLSSIKKDASLIGGLLETPTLTLDSSYNTAASVSAAYSASQEANPSSGVGNDTPTTVLSFVQNNNSPKNLSSVEIYRQTKNQLSVAKGGLPS